MQFKDICTKKEFVEKTYWKNVGTLKTTDDGKMFIELNMFPNTDFYVFDQKQKEQRQQQQQQGYGSEYNNPQPQFNAPRQPTQQAQFLPPPVQPRP